MAAGVTMGIMQTQLRFLMVMIPFSLVATTLILVSLLKLNPKNAWGRYTKNTGIVVFCLFLLTSLPLSLTATLNPAIDGSDASAIQTLFTSGPLTRLQTYAEERYVEDKYIAAHLDSLKLKTGTVLMDDFNTYPIFLASDNPTQFVITPDLDFTRILADPVAYGVQYFIVPNPAQGGILDALNRAYPGIYTSGAGLGKLVATYIDPSGYGPNLRLFKVVG
jgi:hypothetical protein